MKYKPENGGFPRELLEEISGSEKGFALVYEGEEPSVRRFEVTGRDARRLVSELRVRDQDILALIQYSKEDLWPSEFHIILGEFHLYLVEIREFLLGFEEYAKEQCNEP